MSGERLDVLVSRLPFTRDLPQRELVAVRIAEFRDAPEHFLGDPADELDAGRREPCHLALDVLDDEDVEAAAADGLACACRMNRQAYVARVEVADAVGLVDDRELEHVAVEGDRPRDIGRVEPDGTEERIHAGGTMTRPNRPVRPFAVDLPILHPFLAELRKTERLRAFAEAFPARARVSEPALPLLLAALHEELDRPLVLLAPEDADARDLAEGIGWFAGEERVALLPSRGVHCGSGLDPAPHLVGERARALDVLAAGGLVCASAAALAEPLPPSRARPEPIRISPGEEVSLEQIAESLAVAGYDRVERADERGQFAVRGGLVDVFPTTGREPLRIELWGDEIEQIRAFSPFTQRALHPVEGAVVYPAAERRPDLGEPTLRDDELEGPPPVPNDLVPPLGRRPDLVWEADEVRKVALEELNVELGLSGAAELDSLPANQPFAFEAQRPALAARGLSEAENELAALVRAGQRVVVAFPHRGEALRTQNLLRRIDARILEPGDQLPDDAELLFAVAPARRGFVWRELGLVLLPDTQVFRKRAPRAAGGGRAPPG